MCTAVPAFLSGIPSATFFPSRGLDFGNVAALELRLSLFPFSPFPPSPNPAYVCTAACFSHARLLKDFFLTCQEKLASIAIYPVLILLDRDRVHSQEGYIS